MNPRKSQFGSAISNRKLIKELSVNFPDQRLIPRRICIGNIEQFWTNEKLENGQKT